MARHHHWSVGRWAKPFVAGLTLAGAAIMSIIPWAPAAEASAPAAVTAAASSPTPILVTRTTLVHLVCTTTEDPLAFPLPPVLTSVLVQTRSPLSVPFGGTYRLAGAKFTFELGPSAPGFSPRTVWAGVRGPTHTPETGTTYGFEHVATMVVGTNVATLASFPPTGVLGKVGQSIDVAFAPLYVEYFDPLAPPTYDATTYGCAPVAGVPPIIATSVIGPPPGGAPATDYVTFAVRDQTTGAVVYRGGGFVTSGNFYAPSTPPPYPTTRAQLYGTATFPGPDGGQATCTLLDRSRTVRTTPQPGDIFGITLVELSLSDPAAGVDLHAASENWSGTGSTFIRTPGEPEDYTGVAGGHLLTNNDPVIVRWEVRDLA